MPENIELPVLPSTHEIHRWVSQVLTGGLGGVPRGLDARGPMAESPQAPEPAMGTAPAPRPAEPGRGHTTQSGPISAC